MPEEEVRDRHREEDQGKAGEEGVALLRAALGLDVPRESAFGGGGGRFGLAELTLRRGAPALCVSVALLRLPVRALELGSGPARVELRPVRLAANLELSQRLRLRVPGCAQALSRLVSADDRGIRRRLEEDRLLILDPVVDFLVSPDPADQEKDREDGGEQLLRLGRLKLLDVNACAHWSP